MAERDSFELDQALERLLAGDPVPGEAGGAGPLEIAAALRHLPDESFRLRLKSELMRGVKEKEMTPTTNYVRTGMHTINPYLVVRGADAVLEFVKRVFGGEEKLRVPLADGLIMHSEIRVGDMTLEIADATDVIPPAAMSLHAYIPDVDAAYQRALEAGAESAYAPMDQGYGDREAGVRHAGITWFLATHQGARHVPEGLWTVTPYLHVRGAGELIDFIERAFGAGDAEVHRGPDGAVAHAKVRIGDSVLELGEAHGEWGPAAANLHIYVRDTDATYQRALEAGATSQRGPADTPYGDRAAGVVDAWGNQWWIATFLGGGDLRVL